MSKQAKRKSKEVRGQAIWTQSWDEEGKEYREICGRIVWFAEKERYIFEHEHTSSQRHFLTASPGGYDAALLGYLVANQITDVYDIEKSQHTEVVRLAMVDQILKLGQFRAEGGRWRFFMAYSFWQDARRDYEVPPPLLPRINLADNFLRDLVEHMRKLGRPIPAELEGELVTLAI